MRRRRSPLLLAFLGVLAAAAPAARAPYGPDRERDAPAKTHGGKEKERPAAGTKCPVFLRGPAAERPADQDAGGSLVAPDLPPSAVHAHLAAPPERPPSALRPRRDDLKAGLLAIPPPAA